MKANKFLRICQDCKASCCKMGGPDFTETEMKKVLKAGYKNHFFEVRDKIYELKTKKGVCPYLKKDNACEIHKYKPILCLCWPVFPNFDRKTGGFIVLDCPLTKHLSKEEIEKCKEEAAKVSKKLLDVALDYSTVSKEDARILEEKLHKFKITKL
jgi:Fe-S-cluster containining protein